MSGLLFSLVIILSCENALESFKAKSLLPGNFEVIDVRDRFFDQADQVTTSDELVEAILRGSSLKAHAIDIPRVDAVPPSRVTYSNLLLGPSPIAQEYLSEFGALVASAIRGKSFVDLASGHPSISQVPAAIAAHFGALQYVAVDHLNILSDHWRSHVPLTGAEIPSFYFRADVVSFVTRLIRPPQGFVIHIAGLEPSNRGERLRVVRQVERQPSVYLARLMMQLDLLMTHEDVLILGPLTVGLYPDKRDFVKIASVVTRRGAYQLWRKLPPKVWPVEREDLGLLEN